MSFTAVGQKFSRAFPLLLFCFGFFQLGLSPKPLLVKKAKVQERKHQPTLLSQNKKINTPLPIKRKRLEVEVSVGQAKILPVWDLKQVVLGNPELADVKPISDHELLIIGKKTGTTNLILWEGEIRSDFALHIVSEKETAIKPEEVKVEVIPIEHRWLRKYNVDFRGGEVTWTFSKAEEKVEALQKALELLVPSSSFYISPALNTVTVKGTEKDIDLVKSFLKQWDRERPQVIIETRLLEVFHRDLKDLGLSNTVQNDRGQFVNENGEGTLTVDSLGSFSEQYLLKLKALEEKNRARLLANPRLVQIAGEEQYGHIFLGDQVPVKKTTITAAGNAIQSIEYVDVGVFLNIVPMTISEDGTIRLAIVVSATSIKGESQGFPIFTGRRASSEVYVKDGETLVIGGLIKEEDIKSLRKVPFISELPVLGKLFQSTKKTKEKTEVIAVITPHIVE